MNATNPAAALLFNPRALLGDDRQPHSMRAHVPLRGLDAIFIPTRGRADSVAQMLRLWQESDAPLFLLPTTAEDLPALPTGHGAMTALTVQDATFLEAMRELRESADRREWMPSDWDLPLKRNYALWYARNNGLRKILLLDDDIRGLSRADLDLGAAALDVYALAGFYIEEFPDYSVVGHARRGAGQTVPTFLSGSCLFIDTHRTAGFFPMIYNEDLLFMLPHILTGSVRAVGEIQQTRYDPFRTAATARFQELGEILADGVFALIAAGCYSERFSTETWQELLDARRYMLQDLIDSAKSEDTRAALEASLDECRGTSPATCIEYFRGLDRDRERWLGHLGRITT
jgi:hypothetical protein